MFRITFSNHYEALRQRLLDALASPPASPFEADEVIVPSTAVRRDVELAAATRFGICANTRFSYLAQWLWRRISVVVPVGERSPFEPGTLAWRIYEILGAPGWRATQPALDRYVGDGDARNRYALAVRTAGLFDQYVVYRPEWLAAWSAGRTVRIDGDAGDEHQRWQAALWRRIAGAVDAGGDHPSLEYFRRLEAMGAAAREQAHLPVRVHVFAVPTMAPLHLAILRRLAHWIDVDLYVVNPSQEHWLDVVPPRRLSWLALRGRLDHHETGNTLLASWGKQTQQFVDLLYGDDADTVDDSDDFRAADGDNLLARTQNAILDLQELARGSVTLAQTDRSVEVHVCHSLTRELEVLHDRLLALFAATPSLRPADIVVVTPDLPAAAPLIDTVFGTAPAPRRIPYAITGLPASRENGAAAALLALVDLATSRVTASGVFELLERRIVARRFGLDDADLDAIRGWLRDAGIRWGLDAAHRAECGVPEGAGYTFADGLDRLFLGYALADADAIFAGRLPAGAAEGSRALALGGLQAAIRDLARLHRTLSQPKSAAGWGSILEEALATFLAPAGDEIDDLREVDAAIARLVDDIERGGAVHPIPASVVRDALAAALDDPARGGVPTGAVTFSAMTSLRGLPFRVVCVIGMNDRAWPTGTPPVEFDLMPLQPRPGDRQRRLDDRNVFLDLVLAARDALHLSYTGFDARDRATLPPSVLLSELLDVLVPALAGMPTPEAARRRLVVTHPLQPFSTEAFLAQPDVRRQSFDTENCAAARAAELARSQREPPPMPTRGATDEDDDNEGTAAQPRFFAAPLPPPGPSERDLPLETLARFFAQPARHLLRERLGIALPRRLDTLDDDEPFVPGRDERAALARRLLPRGVQGASRDALAELARAGHEYPPGPIGGQALARELAEIDTFAGAVEASTPGPPLPPAIARIGIDVDGESWTIDAGFADLRREGRVGFRFADTTPRDCLDAWIGHLALNAARPEGAGLATMWISRDGGFTLRPLASAADARAHLATLLRLYRDGLRSPLHFFPMSSWAHALGKNPRPVWHPQGDGRGEDADEAYRLALRGVPDPLDAGFEDIAHAVFDPLLDHLDDPRPK